MISEIERKLAEAIQIEKRYERYTQCKRLLSNNNEILVTPNSIGHMVFICTLEKGMLSVCLSSRFLYQDVFKHINCREY